MDLAYSENGKSVAPHLVLIHAFPLNRSMWKYQLDGLADHAHVIAPDLYGCGETPIYSRGETPIYTIKPNMTYYARTIIHFLNQMSINKAILGGCSMGGYILFELWRAYPERFAGLILCDTRAEADTLEARAVRLQSVEAILEQGLSPLAEGMIPKLLSSNTLETKPDLVSDIKNAILTNNKKGVAYAQYAMARRPESTETLYTIDVPTLILVGEQDVLTPPDLARSMNEKIPHSQLHVLPEAGHLSPVEQPEMANQLIRGFINDCKTG